MSSSSAQWRCVNSYREDPFTLLPFLNKEWVLVPGKESQNYALKSQNYQQQTRNMFTHSKHQMIHTPIKIFMQNNTSKRQDTGAHKIVNTVAYLAGSVPSGVVKNSNRRDHCTVTFEVENDIGPSMGMENRKLVW